ncbi:hypothetical protein T265_06174 [Opisthorchis viverrini]|uniref:Uncharacterized protein n=1 Tax=Opisthorchis viverrini TaxID=6198 RepID=A0A074ZH42_OPIVI|nr:hypothetical protein T265_06174 [Opisthorchis viverrini]KER26601.1 hypothetical protein T265_06174 [Opisthorchis viverrini]
MWRLVDSIHWRDHLVDSCASNRGTMGHDDPTDAKRVLVRSFLHYVELMKKDYDCMGQARTLQMLNELHARAKDEALIMLDSEIAADDPAVVEQFRNRLMQNIELQLDKRRNELEDLIKWKAVPRNGNNDGGIDERLKKELDQQKQHYELLMNNTLDEQKEHHARLMKVQLDEQKLFYETLLETKATEMNKLKQELNRISSEKEELQRRLEENTSEATEMADFLSRFGGQENGFDSIQQKQCVVMLRQLLETSNARTTKEMQNELDNQKAVYEEMLKSKDRELEELRQDRERLSGKVEELQCQLECSCNEAVATLEHRAAELGQLREERDRLSNEVNSLRQQVMTGTKEATEQAARHKAELEDLTGSWQQMLRTKEELLEFKTAELTRNPNLFLDRKDEEIRQLKTEILLKDRSIEDLKTLLHTVDNSNEIRKASLQVGGAGG